MNGDKSKSQIRFPSQKFRDGYDRIEWNTNAFKMIVRCVIRQSGSESIVAPPSMVRQEDLPYSLSTVVVPEEREGRETYPL